MPDFMLEIYSEEIPARMQRPAAAQFLKQFKEQIESFGIEVERASAFVTPHRLCIDLRGLPEESRASVKIRRGPRVGAPEKAISGFARSAGIDVETLEIRQEKKGEFYFAEIKTSGSPIDQILSAAVSQVITEFRWQKSMRWGTNPFRWVRPIRSVVGIVYNDSKSTILDISIGENVCAGDVTRGHSTMAPDAFRVLSFDDYRRQLEERFVLVDSLDREQRILKGALALAKADGLELVEDTELLEEISGLVEWPVPMMAEIDPKFMSLPQDILITSMRSHQKYLAVNCPDTKQITHFVVVTNREAADGGKAILEGNRLVLTARLEDAAFVWGNDLRQISTPGGFDEMQEKLAQISYHSKLGSLGDKVRRLANLSDEIAGMLGADQELARCAALAVKSDLVSETVGEFPELQGVIGQHLATSLAMHVKIANACAEHYRPSGPSESVPTEDISVIVGLADRIDQLVGFFSIGEAPTGSKDPFALRRAALGIIRLCIGNEIRLPLNSILEKAYQEYRRQSLPILTENSTKSDEVTRLVMAFVHERFAVHLNSLGVRHDIANSCLAMKDSDDLTLLSMRTTALSHVLKTEDGERLLHGFRRANNILEAEFGSTTNLSLPEPNEDLAVEPSEKAMFTRLAEINQQIAAAVADEKLEAGMAAMANLSSPIDRFFEKVRVQSDDKILRDNRLRLLAAICQSIRSIADFRQIES